MKPSLPFRSARPEEAEPLTEITRAAKRHWDYPDEWMEAWRDELTVTPEFIRTQPVQVAELDCAIAGFFGLRHGADGCHLEHLWLRPAHIGAGLGRMLFEEAVRQARAAGVTELKIKADPNAEPFYLKMGAVRTGLEVYQLLGKVRREVPLMVYRL
jgi:GNAT superfamily N-acetyltransferase